ncbi:MAG: copper amine oxidase N-terminal domain-containing protein [Defluviitaleaceae bacterium]|nr:copper amine oxidase N-terminal domain-containing protein [Defluviitaleaceae bacterium]
MRKLELSVCPIKVYNTPEIPTFEDDNSAMLKKIPKRWKKNAKVIAGLGFIGALALSSVVRSGNHTFPQEIVHNLGHTQGSYRGFSQENLLVRLHTGGMGSSFYMVHLTEQEAFGIIRARLEAAGLNFDATPPPRIVSDPTLKEYNLSFSELLFMGRPDGIDFDLFDAQNGIAVTYVRSTHRSFLLDERHIARLIEEIFAELDEEIIVGAFHNPGRIAGRGAPLPRLLRRPFPWETAAARPILVRQLINQADKFIAILQSEGILEHFPDVDVIINGVLFNHGEYPLIINDQKMVPALELFEALGMDTVVSDNGLRIAITATRNNVEIWVTSNGSIAVNPNVNRNRFSDWPEDIPMLVHNDIVLAPLQFVADFVGATIEWNEDDRILNITY